MNSGEGHSRSCRPPSCWRSANAAARVAQQFLSHALNCPANHPVRQCPDMIQTLDRLLAGLTFEQLATEHTGRPESPPPRRPARRV